MSTTTTTPLLAIATRGLALLAAFALASGAAAPDGAGQRSWDFESDEPGKIAAGFANESGRWAVVEDGKNRVLAQQAAGDDDAFNVALIEGASAKDLDLSVRLKAVAGRNDQGGGLAWRARDAKNYYLARYNPLEDNVRVYKVVAGKRTMLEHAKVPGDNDWHTLRVAMKGPKVACYLDGKKCLEAEDSTFPDAGRVGLWTKADARSYFDDLALTP